jgi:LuxR family glucitol operon transcriptional activator
MNREEVQQLVAFAEQLLERTTYAVFSDLEKITLEGIISDRSYEQMTLRESTEVTPNYLRQTISPKLRKKLTDALKELGVVDANTKILLKKEVVPKLRQAWNQKYPRELASDGYRQPSLVREAPGGDEMVNSSGVAGLTRPPFQNGVMESFSHPQRIYQNLPTRDHTTFIGHQKQLKHLLKLLSWESRIHRISVEGIGGAGKTTLIVEAAYSCLDSADSPKFDAMIFTSAKPHRLTGTGILPRLKKENTLSEILRTIARTLQRHDLLMGDSDRQLEEILDCLSYQRTLLMIDNLETAADLDDVRSFLFEAPPTVKVLITSRQQALLDISLHLECFNKTDSLHLIHHHAREKDIPITPQQSEVIYTSTGGIPAAIVYTIGQLSAGYHFTEAIAHLNHSDGEIARYCFEGSVLPLREKPPHLLLMALAIFPSPALPEAISQVADVPNGDEFFPLQQLSLVKVHQGRYVMLPLTRGYVLGELDVYPEFQKAARERWVTWYLNYCQKYGKTDPQEWSEFTELDQEWENLSEAIEWTILENRYEQFGQFWQYIKGYTHFAGYWPERLRWMDWWREQAKTRADWLRVVEAIGDKSRTLILLDQPEHHQEASHLLNLAWELCQTYQLTLGINLALDMAVFQVHQQNERGANQWLSEVNKLYQNLPSHDPRYPRIPIQILYYRGELHFKKQEFVQAQQCYEKALEKSRNIGWHRGMIFCQIWLALVAINLKLFQKAETLLEEAFPLVEQNGDRRCLAFCKRAFALLKKAQGDWQEAKSWAAKARADFRDLLMRREVAEMDEFLYRGK